MENLWLSTFGIKMFSGRGIRLGRASGLFCDAELTSKALTGAVSKVSGERD